jgi:hypothetical protein
MEKVVLLSFDLEEFDMPLEYGGEIGFSEQIEISSAGCEIILNLLARHNIQATFFSTVVFAGNSMNIIRRVVAEGHELASHGYFHSAFETTHLKESREQLSNISGSGIHGFRMPRMGAVNDIDVLEAGYSYNSSINPTYLPGRYNNLFKSRTITKQHNMWIVPASVTPLTRLPLFWLSFHILPLWMYKLACISTMNSDNHLNCYFHPWEFCDISIKKYKLPSYVVMNSGAKMLSRFENMILWMKNSGYRFTSIESFLKSR